MAPVCGNVGRFGQGWEPFGWYLVRVRRAVWLWAGVLLGGCGKSVTLDLSNPARYGNPITMIQISDKRIRESSGVAPSLTQPGAYYTHNDSGDRARFFRFDESGKVAEFDVRNARNVDWEDVASAKLDGKPYLFFGDIGDNSGRRKEIKVYRVPEPSGEGGTVAADEMYTLRYPDEPHNAETLMVHPVTGDIYVVTKASKRPAMVFKGLRPKGSGNLALRLIGSLELGGSIRESRTVTGGAISPDGKRVVLRTYLGAYEYEPPESGFDKWVGRAPKPVPTNLEAQGESITYKPDGSGFVTTSEGLPMQVSEIPVKR